MLRLGIIGTNWITHSFVNAALASGEYELTAIYSRGLEKAEAFAKEYDNADSIHLETSLEAFFHREDVDVVYLASPNSMHYEQAKLAMEAGKHVISEKPAVSTLAELEELVELAEAKEVFFFEAARHIHEDNFQRVESFLKGRDDILGANFNFMKYSSRYDALLRGEEPNIFSPKFSGGALMDLGIYLVYAAIGWFGVPKEAHYFHRQLPTKVDGMGHMVLRYDTFDVTLMTGKHADSNLLSEIYLSDSTIELDGISTIGSVIQKKREEDGICEVDFSGPIADVPMIEEAIAFAKVMTNPMNVKQQKLYQDWIQLARDVHELMEKMRKESGIVFAADSK